MVGEEPTQEEEQKEGSEGNKADSEDEEEDADNDAEEEEEDGDAEEEDQVTAQSCLQHTPPLYLALTPPLGLPALLLLTRSTC